MSWTSSWTAPVSSKTCSSVRFDQSGSRRRRAARSIWPEPAAAVRGASGSDVGDHPLLLHEPLALPLQAVEGGVEVLLALVEDPGQLAPAPAEDLAQRPDAAAQPLGALAVAVVEEQEGVDRGARAPPRGRGTRSRRVPAAPPPRGRTGCRGAPSPAPRRPPASSCAGRGCAPGACRCPGWRGPCRSRPPGTRRRGRSPPSRRRCGRGRGSARSRSRSGGTARATRARRPRGEAPPAVLALRACGRRPGRA